jgi:hypothetical protein
LFLVKLKHFYYCLHLLQLASHFLSFFFGVSVDSFDAFVLISFYCFMLLWRRDLSAMSLARSFFLVSRFKTEAYDNILKN